MTAEVLDIGKMTEYYRHIYTHKPDSLEGKDQFLKTHNRPKLNQHEAGNTNSHISIKAIALII